MCTAVLGAIALSRYVFHVRQILLLALSVAWMSLGCDDRGSVSIQQHPLADASAPADQQDANVATACIEGVLRWYRANPAASVYFSSQLEPCSTFTHSTVSVINVGPSASCTQELTPRPQGVSVQAVNDALAADDVQASFTDPPTFYGASSDALRIAWGEATVYVGDDCTTSDPSNPNCAVPEGLQSLRDLLDRVTSEQLEQRPCSNTFGSPNTLAPN
jgi:hypothetical protein